MTKALTGRPRREAALPTQDLYTASSSQSPEFQSGSQAPWLATLSCLPMQGTRVRALVREDPTCHGATKPVHHSY